MFCYLLYKLFFREGGGGGDLRYLRIPQPPTQEQGSLSGKTGKVTTEGKAGF